MKLHPSMAIARYVFGLTAAVFLLYAFVRAWNEARGRVLPSPLSIVMGGAALLLGLGCATSGSAVFFESAESRGTLAHYFVVLQLRQYIRNQPLPRCRGLA